MPLELILPQSYPYILMGLTAHFFFLNMIPPLFLMKVKKEVYSPDHMKRYQEEHKLAFGEDKEVNNMALPD